MSDLCAADFAAAVAFYGVHAGVGGADDDVDGVFRRAGGEAYAGAGGELETAAHEEARVDEVLVECGRCIQGFPRGSFGHHDDELIASVAEAHVFGTGELFEARADAAEEFAANEMAVDVVHQLEPIEVNEGETHGFALTVAALDFLFHNFVEVADVVETGGVVGDGELLDARNIVCVFDGDGGVIAEDVEEGDGVIAQLAGAGIEDFDHALHAFATAEGHGNDGANGRAVGGERVMEAGIVFGFGDNEGFGVFGDPPGNAFADADAEIAEFIFTVAGGDCVVELSARFVHHQQGPHVGGDEAFHLLEDGAEDGIEIEAGVERSRKLMKDHQVIEGDAILS